MNAHRHMVAQISGRVSSSEAYGARFKSYSRVSVAPYRLSSGYVWGEGSTYGRKGRWIAFLLMSL